MKIQINLLMVCLMACTIAHAQDNFKLSLEAFSLEPDYKQSQVHILSLENTSNSNLTVELIVENAQCEQKRSSKHSDLEHIFLNKNASKTLNNSIVLNPNQIFEFSIKIIKPKNVLLGSTNCSKVIARTTGDKVSEHSVIIQSYIPDPTTDN